jgi:predicted TPR repeat methyltransferase
MNQHHTPSMDPLFDIMLGPVKMAVLETALELKIADVLADEMDKEALAKALNIETDPAGLGFFLDSMTAMGFLKKQSGKYRNTGFASCYLNSKSPLYMKRFVDQMKAMQHKNLGQIARIVKTGPPEVEKTELLDSEAKWEKAVAHLSAYQRAGMARIAADLVQALPEFSHARKLLDLGGGPGLIGAEMVKRHPGLEGVLLDQPAVVRLAKKELMEEGLRDRISFISGDYNEVCLGEGYDIVWASHNLYYVRDRAGFFARLKAAMSHGGVLLCLHEGLTHERTRPLSIVLSRLSLALEGQDVSFEKGEIFALLENTGFAPVESRPMDLGTGQCELVIARKGAQ